MSAFGRVAAIAAVALTAVSSPRAQTACDDLVASLNDKNAAIERAMEAVKKLRSGPPEFCTEARKLAETSAMLARQIKDKQGLCSDLDPKASSTINLMYEISVSGFNATLVDGQIDMLCR
jgi:hypothetical protein